MKILKNFLILFNLIHGIAIFGQTTAENSSCAESLDPSIRFGQLDNGFRYYIKTVNTKNPKVMMSMYIRAGEEQEDKNQYGLAHFLEHMATGYTKNFTHLYNNVKLLNPIGMDKGDVGASTLGEYTKYMFNFPVDNGKALETGLSWFRGIVGGEVEFQKRDVDGERGAIYQELVNGQARENYMNTKIYNTIYRCGAPLIRWKDHKNYFQTFDIRKLIRFYNDWYRPDLSALILVGNIKNMDATEYLVRNMFSGLPTKLNPRPREDCYLDYLERPHQFVVMEKDKGGFGSPSEEVAIYSIMRDSQYMDIGTWEGVKRRVIKQLLGKAVRLRFLNLRKHAYHPFYKFIYRYSQSGKSISMLVTATGGKEQEALQQAFGVLKAIKLHGLTNEEWNTLREEKLQKIQHTYDNSHYWAGAMADHFVYGEALPPNKNQKLQNWLRNLSLEELHKLISEVLPDMPEDIGIIAPPGNKALSYKEEEMLKWIKEATPIANISTQKVPEKLMTKEEVSALPDVVYTKKEKPELGVKELKLKNGVKIVLLNENDEGNKIMVHGFSPRGISCFPKKEYFATAFAPTIFKNSGLGNWSKFQLDQFLAKTSFPYGVRPYIDYTANGIKGEAALSDLENLLQLMYLYFTAPEKNMETFNIWKNKVKESYLQRGNGVLNFDIEEKLIESIAKNSTVMTPVGTQLFQGSTQVNLDDAYRIHRDLYGNAKNFTFFVSGKYPEDKSIPLLVKYLGNLPNEDKSRDCPSSPVLPKEIHKISLYKKMTPEEGLNNDKILWSYIWPIDSFYNWREDIKLDFLSRVIAQKLGDLRHIKKRGVYRAFARKQNVEPLRWSTIRIKVDCATEELDLVLGDIEEIIRELKNKKITSNMFDWISRGLVEKYQAAVVQENVQEKSKKLYQHYRFGEDLITPSEMLHYVQSLTQEDILKTARQYLKDQHRSEYVVKSKAVIPKTEL